jgi:hypothetical protein
MNVLGHHDISQHHQPIAPAHTLKDLQEEIGMRSAPEKRLALITTERQKMQIVAAIEAVQVCGHGEKLEPMEGHVCDN